jgi:pimeloyl-ACP methyl ester carboxylesterase
MIDRYWELLRFPGNRQAMSDQFATPRPDRSALLETLPMPVLLIWGEEDLLIPTASGEAMAALIPQAELIVYEGVGHLPMEEAPERTAAAIADYLERIGL